MKDHEESDAGAFKRLEDKLDAHMEEMRPYMQAAAGLGLLWKLLFAVGGAVLLYVQLKQYFTGH